MLIEAISRSFYSPVEISMPDAFAAISYCSSK